MIEKITLLEHIAVPDHVTILIVGESGVKQFFPTKEMFEIARDWNGVILINNKYYVAINKFLKAYSKPQIIKPFYKKLK